MPPPKASHPSSPQFDRKPRTPALALNVEQACAALAVSHDTWKDHIEPDVRIVRVGRRKVIPVTELQRYLDEHAERAI
jgi:hypothetical protein